MTSSFGEVDVSPAGGDVAEQCAAPDACAVGDGWHDVPVGMLSRTLYLDHGDVLAVARDAAAADSVDGGAVECGDIDSEVERRAALRSDAWVARARGPGAAG